jgi:hypothetical protein
MLHGLLAAAGITLLFYAAIAVGIPQLAELGLALFLIAAFAGAVLNLRYQGKAVLLRRGLLVGHAGLAVVAFTRVVVSACRVS